MFSSLGNYGYCLHRRLLLDELVYFEINSSENVVVLVQTIKFLVL